MKNLLLFTIFITLTLHSNAQTVTDIDGNVYNTITIGTQTWMAENLKTTKYNDGAAIPNITNNSSWYTKTTGAYCDLSNTPENSTTYGRLYNWYAVDNNAATMDKSNGGKNVCPSGWHVPTDDEWTILTTYLGGEDIAGGKLKETGTTHWASPNTGANNETGFTALPGGFRKYDGTFNNYVTLSGSWWSTTELESSSSQARDRWMNYKNDDVRRDFDNKVSGNSVRCVKNNNTTLTNSIKLEEVIIYPNPAIEQIYFKNVYNSNTIIMIFELQGKQILNKQINTSPIDISNLSKGIYIVKIIDSEKTVISKLIKE